MLEPKKHILIVTPGFPENESDTKCIPPLQDYVKALSEHPKYWVSVIAVHYPVQKAEYKWNGIDVFACGGNNGSLLKKPFIWWRAHQFFRRINEESEVDLLHTFWYSECALLGAFMQVGNDVPQVVTLMGQEGIKGNYYEKFLDQSFFELVAVSDFQKQKFAERTGIEVKHKVGWGFDNPFPQKDNSANKSVDVIGVGSLIPLKNYTSFINIIKSVTKKFPELKVKVIGDGPERKMLQLQIDDLRLNENIEMLGSLSREDTLIWIERSRVLLHTSMYESFGMVFIEALALGTNVVSREIGIAKDAPNWYVGESDDDLENGIYQMLVVTGVSDGQHHSVDETVKAYHKIYSDLFK